jgi:hypothetical protein
VGHRREARRVLAGITKRRTHLALTECELSDLLAALKAGEMTDTIRTSLQQTP